MAHFAELNDHNEVLRVIAVNDEDCQDEAGEESETVGAAFCEGLLGGRWIQTSYRGGLRGQFAGVGMRYDSELDMFVPTEMTSGDSW